MENIEQQDPVEEKTESQEVVVDSVTDLPDYSNKTLKEIIEIFRQMLDKGDQQEMYKNADALKAAFYKILKKEKIAAGVFNLPVAALQNTEDSAEGENVDFRPPERQKFGIDVDPLPRTADDQFARLKHVERRPDHVPVDVELFTEAPGAQ